MKLGLFVEILAAEYVSYLWIGLGLVMIVIAGRSVCVFFRCGRRGNIMVRTQIQHSCKLNYRLLFIATKRINIMMALNVN